MNHAEKKISHDELTVLIPADGKAVSKMAAYGEQNSTFRYDGKCCFDYYFEKGVSGYFFHGHAVNFYENILEIIRIVTVFRE